MTVVKKSKMMPYTCSQMYALVDECERYHEFLPYFEKTQVHHRNEDEVEATLIIQAAGMKKSFTTRNRLQKDKMIELRLVDGPFKRLEGFWRFDPVESGCVVSLDLEFEFAGGVLSMFLSPIFEQVTESMVDAFYERAKVLYV